MSKAYKNIEGKSSFADLAIQHLIKGLPDQQKAYEIATRTPKTISEAVDMIILHEACKDNAKKRSGIRHLVPQKEDCEM
jgi:hypothetical protein